MYREDTLKGIDFRKPIFTLKKLIPAIIVSLYNMQIIKGGLFTTIQDSGRYGYRHLGIPQSGVMDSRAQRHANWLVGNSWDAPVLECSFLGGTFRFQAAQIIALTGADMNARLNNTPCQMYRSIAVKSGDLLSLAYAHRGIRTYIAMQGIPDIEPIMESCSTYVSGGFGGFRGRALQAGDVLKWSNEVPKNPNRLLPEHLHPHFSTEKNIIRILQGPEWEKLSKASQEMVEKIFYKIHTDSNRMGIRLIGEGLMLKDNFSMASSATIPGTIQLPANGQPIILMHDGQTTGGYPRIGKVIEADLGRLAQIPPKGNLNFRIVKEAEARQLFLYENKKLVVFH